MRMLIPKALGLGFERVIRTKVGSARIVLEPVKGLVELLEKAVEERGRR